ncbi:hypothetical protein PGT21_019809 [Puccinia graminis f. sp. tritici]|uniref:Uncharacterized protein n=1 Tax=Puccinia graminis f. sp. tritici TaxID=56615 RepID=A0A5B0PSA3_PUCGR|nr:hypothetical protein PGT21_019809 [Puccinia graminis f. sp. tritici]
MANMNPPRYHVSHVWGLGRYSWMVVKPSGKTIDVHFSMTSPAEASEAVGHRTLNLNKVCRALEATSGEGKEASKQLQRHARTTLSGNHQFLVDHPMRPLETQTSWMSFCKNSESFNVLDSPIAKVINKVCTQQIHDRS